MIGYSTTPRHSARPETARIVLNVKTFPNCLNPNKMNGMFTIKMKSQIGQAVIFVSSNEMPVAPPSIKSFGNRKLFNPKPAEMIPPVIIPASLMFPIIVFLFR